MGDSLIAPRALRTAKASVVVAENRQKVYASSDVAPYRHDRQSGGMSCESRRERRELNAMKDDYDLSKAERGKFGRPNAVLAPPVHLEPEVLAFLTARAEARGVSLSELVNALLKKDIELIEAAE
jgi:hypothetical protein